MTMQDYDAVLITEETISPEEFLRRRNAEGIAPDKVKIVPLAPTCLLADLK